MGKANIEWGKLGFNYSKTPQRYVANYKDGKWEPGFLTDDNKVVISECAGILQYCQEIFEGLKAYTQANGDIVAFRPDLNADRMFNSAKRMEMPPYPKEDFVAAVDKVVTANCRLCTSLW